MAAREASALLVATSAIVGIALHAARCGEVAVALEMLVPFAEQVSRYVDCAVG